jgi:hypothetical protein
MTTIDLLTITAVIWVSIIISAITVMILYSVAYLLGFALLEMLAAISYKMSCSKERLGYRCGHGEKENAKQ